ncbi:MAG: thiamine phosphate synthase [Campylobacterales bacterium]|nr:thiamine phosphate synthase [Campylobacterales bacterium]
MSHLKGLYGITDERLTPDDRVYEQVREALKAGVRIIQYRNKTATDTQVEALCKSLQLLCRDHGALFIIDDRVALATRIRADGIHIGKDDTALKEVRRLFDGIIGVSCYGSVRHALEAQENGADYVAFGSFYPSPTKPQSGIVKLEVLRKAKEALRIPICAIGGINAENIGEVAAYAPDMISVVTALFDGDITQNSHTLLKGMHRDHP